MIVLLRVSLMVNNWSHCPLQLDILASALTGFTSSYLFGTPCVFGVDVEMILPYITLFTCLDQTPPQFLIITYPGILHIWRILEHPCRLLCKAIFPLLTGIRLLIWICIFFSWLTFKTLNILLESLHFWLKEDDIILTLWWCIKFIGCI